MNMTSPIKPQEILKRSVVEVLSKTESLDAALPVTLTTYRLLLDCGHEATFKTMLPRYTRQFRCTTCEAEQ
jgi:hypothetical protein